MSYEHKDGRGSIFKNDRKEQPTHPDYKGSARIGGVDYWVSAWIEELKEGGKYLSFSFQPKDAPAPAPQTTTDDELPF